jgi:hypothetical protein
MGAFYFWSKSCLLVERSELEMRSVVFVCPSCREEARLAVSLDSRMVQRFAEGMHVYCDECSRYQRMLPQEAPRAGRSLDFDFEAARARQQPVATPDLD